MNASQRSPVGAVPPTDGPSRYARYLALLPVTLIVGAVMAPATPVPVSYGAGALPAALVLGYELFRDAPSTRAVGSAVERGRRERERRGERRGRSGDRSITPADGRRRR